MNSTLRKSLPESHLLVAGCITLFVVVVYWSSFSTMYELWQRSDHRHGILVFPIAGFLIWRVRERIASATISPNATGLALLLFVVAGWLLARLVGIQIVEHFLVLTMIPVAVFTLCGREMTERMLFPLLFLLLATPISDSLIPYLMLITADISTALLQVSGFPVFRQGQYISLPGGDFVVADVCSGNRYLLTGVMISSLFAYLTYQSKSKRFGFVAITAVVLVLANGVRAYIVMAVASASEMQYLGGRDHIYFGWLMFGIVIILLMWIGMRYADPEIDFAATSDQADEGAASSRWPIVGALGLVMLAVTLKPLEADFQHAGIVVLVTALILAAVLFSGQSLRRGANTGGLESDRMGFGFRDLTVAIIAVVIIVSGSALTNGIGNVSHEPADAPSLAKQSECDGPMEWANRWIPVMQEPDFELSGTYRCTGRLVHVYSAGYSAAGQGQELISSANNLRPASWTRYSRSRTLSSGDTDGLMFDVVEVMVETPGYSGVSWHWYVVDDRRATSPLWVKTLQAWATIQGRPSGGKVILLETRVDDDLDAARDQLAAFAATLSASE